MTDFNGIDCEDAKQACMYEEENKILEAEHVFVLMKKEYRISRNIRAQWYFGHLNKTIGVLPRKNLAEFTEEIGVVSVLPKTCPEGWNPKESHKYQYRVTPFTKTMFFAHQYRIVFCLDLSSSVGTVDIQHGSILFDEIYQVLRKCTKGAVKPFEIPGSGFLFRPNIYVTVIAHMPFYRSGVNQVLVHGWQMTEDNVNRFLDLINCKLYEVLACVVEATSKTNEQQQICLVEKDNAKDAVVGDVPDSCEHQMTITPNINTVDMLRYGILALHLLPENSGAAIIVITDGMLSMPNVSLLESLLTQLRNSTIACSFFQLGSCYHPFSNLGFVPYTDLMNFIATATFGTYLPTCPDVEKCSVPDLNIYHQALFAWNFQQPYPDDRLLLHDMPDINVVEWGIENCNFYTSQNQPFIKKRQLETNLVAPLSSILSCRLREGYTVKSVSFRKGDGKIQVRLVLPWKSNVMLEYVVLAAWPPRSKNDHPPCSTQPESCHCELIVEGSYDFLHDVTCVKKPIKSFYREAVVCNFWNTLKNLSHTDQLLAHLHSFTYNSVFYTIPDSIKNGVPLFCLPPNTSKPVLFSKNSSHTQFASFWKPICMLDINVWQKWMHTHRIGLVLQHDEPLPKNVLLPNSSGRYGQVQCRQALTLVDALLRDYSSFVLIENHSYIKFLFGDLEKPPTAFYIIRVISKASCMVIRLAFLGGTPGYKRNMIVNELKDKLLNLKLPKRGKNKEVQVQTDKREDSLRNVESSEALIQSQSCCVLLRKPVEKILIRYERVPSDFLSSIPSLITNHGMRKQGVSIPEHAVTNTLTTLRRYLHHHRWIWTVQNSPSTPLPLAAVARILSTLTKRRRQEGFHFGHSYSGITNMVIELDMQSEDHVLNEIDMQVHTNSDLKKETHPCVVQYVLFPPYSNTTLVESISDEDGEIEMAEADGELQLITECWVEPQHGVVTVQPPYCDFLQGLNYQELVNAFHLVDLECISALITFEHLCLMCQNMKVPSPVSEPLKLNSSTCSSKADQQHSILSGARSTPDVMLSQTSILNHKYEPTITQVPFSFDLLNLLPKCQQAELLFSTFIQDINRPGDVNTEEKDISNIKLFHFLMENLNKIHDREIILGPREIEQLRRKIFERERNLKAPSIPFIYQCGTDIFVKGGCKDISPMLKQKYQNGKHILKDDYDDENIVNWRCFAKNASPNHVLLTVIPASYKDLKKLVLTKLETDENYLNARSVRCVEKVVDANSPSQRENETCKVFQDGETKEDVQDKNELVDGATLPSPVEQIMKDNEPENTSTNHPYGFVILPVYIYDCHLGSVINQLVYEEDFKKYQDIYQDMTFKTDSSYSEAESIGFSYCESQQSKNSKQPSPECRSEEGETYSDKLYLKRHCNLVEAAFSKSFVYTLFRCLHQGHHLEKQDVEAVVDGICQENLLEVDITHFLQMICGHVKDFKVKMSMEETCKSFEKSSNKTVLEQDIHKKCGDASIISEGESWRKNFPLDLLQRHHPCEPLQQLHSSIKQKFTKVFQTFFHPIPSLPDFYFFFSEQQGHQVEYNDVAGGINEQSDDNENAERSETEADSQMEHVRFVPDQEMNDFPLKESEAPPSCEEASSLSEDTSIGRQSVLSSLEDEDEKNIWPNYGVSIPPLFVHLTCSVRTNRNVGNCSLKSLPTCLGEVISSLEEPGSNIDLDDLQVTLDVLCLTLHPEMEELVESDKTVHTVSYCSTSPMPESEPWKFIDEDEDDLSASHSDIQTEIACHQLSHLPSFQQETMKMCIQRIEWMFQDEIASAALGSFPLVPSTLDFVVNHVENSKGFLTCLKDEVPLHFVFGPDLSLDKFIEELKQMTLPGYHLSKLGEYYYLVVDPESEEHAHHSFGSLVPPLGLASRDLRIPQHPHGDDSTVLKKASWELQNVVFPLLDQNSNRGLLIRQNKSGEMEDDNQIMGMPLIMERNIDHKYVNSVSQAVRDEDKGTETEENETTELNRSRPVRKVSSKNLKDKSHCASRSALVAPEESSTQSASRSASVVPSESSTMFSESVSVTEIPVTFSSEIAFTKNKNPVKSGEQLTILLSTSAVDNVTCGSTVRDRSDSISSFSGESHPVEIPGALVHPAVQQLQGTQDSLRSTPVLFHDTEVSSFIGSEHVSNTEDGYEGDSSDSASDWDWLNVLDTRRPLMPRFWFILKVLQDYVYVYCHIRHREQEDDELRQCKEIFSQVVQIIKDVCKVVNQTLLLQDLHESRMCNQLLVPEASEDIWKQEGGFLSTGKVAHMYGHSMLGADEHDAPEQQSYLEATMKFMPGTFDCGVVWETHFTLHPRLNTGPGHNVVSRGIRALRAVLNPFSVNNRKNMFVYQERSGSVFYLRLNETLCQGHSGYGLSKREDESSLSDSPSSLVSSNPQKKLAGDEEEFNDFRPRFGSGFSDHDTNLDNISMSSRASTTRKNQRCIALQVHGIGEVGSEIKEDFVQVLQNRLDDAVLDMISVMLERNPMCKLTPEDVQFIQKPGKKPASVFHFTIPTQTNLHAVEVFLRQNLLSFLNNPKYTDSKAENRFKHYNEDASSASVADNNVFLYCLQQASGTTGSKGLACVIFSMVNGQGQLIEHLYCPPPSPLAYQDGFSSYELNALTSTALYEDSSNCNSKIPGPLALIQFQVWCVGKVGMDQLVNKLKAAVTHALWDILMEYRLLTAPLAEATSRNDSEYYSEPTTPVRTRRSGYGTIQENSPTTGPLQPSLHRKELSASVPDIQTRSHSVITSPKEPSSFFKFGGVGSSQDATRTENGVSTEISTDSCMSLQLDKNKRTETLHHITHAYEAGDRGKLSSIIHQNMKSVLEFGKNLGVPTVVKHKFSVSSQHCIRIVLKEYQTAVNDLTPDVLPKVFIKLTDGSEEFLSFNTMWKYYLGGRKPGDPYNMLCTVAPGEKKHYIVVGRNVNQWRAFMGCDELSCFLESAFVPQKGQKTYQLYQPYLCQDKSRDSSAAVSHSSLLTVTSPLPSTPLADISVSESPLNCSNESTTSPFVPRQRFLILFVNDKELTLYLYNWATELCTSIISMMTRLVLWHNSRAIVLNSVISQKLGFFNNQPLERAVKTIHGTQKSQTVVTSFLPINVNQITLLIKYLSPPHRDIQHGSIVGGRHVISGSSQTNFPNMLEFLRDSKPPHPLHKAHYGLLRDPVMRHGKQLDETRINSEGRDLQDLQTMWQARGSSTNVPFMDKLHLVRKVGRLTHFCLTPLLFSPAWRRKVGPIRDHTFDNSIFGIGTGEKATEQSQTEQKISGRSRHNSGSSVKGFDSISISVTSRSRWMSGTSQQTTITSASSSPKLRRSAPDETWHFAVCSNYIQEYIQYLQSQGFVAVQTKTAEQKQGTDHSKDEDSKQLLRNISSSGLHSLVIPRMSTKDVPAYFLVRFLLGGLLVFEVGLCDPYAYCHLYSLELMRMPYTTPRALNSQFTTTFLDELERIKVNMHQHSFTYDYHLRTIHSYISGRQLIFRQGYHLTSFLDDFLNYYQKSPNSAHNLVYSGSVVIDSTSMPPHQLYNYIISHNEVYGMRVLRMVPFLQDPVLEMDTEYVLVELSTRRVIYRDANDFRQTASFDVGLLIAHDTISIIQKETQNNCRPLVLKFYILLTSQRELYPKLFNFDSMLGTFRLVRIKRKHSSSNFSSRKTSSNTDPISDRNKLNDSLGSSTETQSHQEHPQYRPYTAVHRVCDEEVSYLSYYSNHETMMQVILQEQAERARSHLTKVVQQAAVDCRRDYLWSCLMNQGLKDLEGSGAGSREGSSNTINYNEFTELMKLVKTVTLSDLDPQLSVFDNMHISWYQRLTRVLTVKYADSHVYFVSPDGNIIYMTVLHTRCPDVFILLSVNLHIYRTNLCLVFRHHVKENHTPERPNVRVLAIQSMVEDFVNACCYHLWTGIVC